MQFNGLALVIIDEQHRFGVHQRLALWEKGLQQGFHPHQLIMTATPIPRTLAMTAYADLDTSTIDELPPGRTPVTTVAIPDTRRSDIIDRVRNACTQEGRQAYWVCTLIEESELLEAQAAEATWEELKLALPELNVGLVHGRMKPAEKQAVMQSFKQGDLHLLIATTVIEVGVDVPQFQPDDHRKPGASRPCPAPPAARARRPWRGCVPLRTALQSASFQNRPDASAGAA
ncbi:ATP-dependent DNA helicase RecG [Enterobacter asburiae]|uniref:ATP-dependent DNA helicase RecG n=1 Tax=Enterobacter asburiae TaxID=61645 RepID=A0A376FGW8_ENTAS|nr:ATP-dependent DNA helicase RecG [Enterobacter asburiae]